MKVLILEGGISAFTVRNDAATCKERENMKICKMAISSVAVLLVLLSSNAEIFVLMPPKSFRTDTTLRMQSLSRLKRSKKHVKI